MTVLGVVLAAGAGRRFTESGGEGPKQRASVAGVPMVVVVLEAVLAAGLHEVVLVQGATDLIDLTDLTDLTDLAPNGIRVLHNPRWEEGLATSLHVALDHARAAGHDAAVVGLADQPGVPAEAWGAMAIAPSTPPIAVASYRGHRGHPVRLHHTVWDLLPTTGDEGARAVMRDRPDLVREVPCIGEPHDVDTLEDLERWS